MILKSKTELKILKTYGKGRVCLCIVLLEPLGAADEIIVSLGKTIEEGGHEFIMYGDKPLITLSWQEGRLMLMLRILSNLPFPDEVVEECSI